MSEMSTAAGAARNGTIVVGVDGSPSSIEALRWAARQAQMSNANLKVVIAWVWPVMSGYAPPPPEFDLERDARVVAESSVRQALGDGPPQPVEIDVTEGSPAEVLIKQAHDAELLVVGSRGHGAFAGMLLGSVSTHCVSHASCPVVVVRGHGADQAA